MNVKRSGSDLSRPAPADHFVGTVRLDSPFQGTEPASLGGAIVTFEPGARSNWHTHPLGQFLLVTSGRGWAQGEGERKALARCDHNNGNEPSRLPRAPKRSQRHVVGTRERRSVPGGRVPTIDPIRRTESKRGAEAGKETS